MFQTVQPDPSVRLQPLEVTASGEYGRGFTVEAEDGLTGGRLSLGRSERDATESFFAKVVMGEYEIVMHQGPDEKNIADGIKNDSRASRLIKRAHELRLFQSESRQSIID